MAAAVAASAASLAASPDWPSASLAAGTHALPRLPARANCVITARVRRVHRMWYLKKKKKQRQGGGNDVEVTGGKV